MVSSFKFSTWRTLRTELGSEDLSVLFDIVKPKYLVVSTNMYDFFTSATNASFRSCYSLDGVHFNGNIAYMTDQWTFITYTYSDNIHRKIGRSWGYLIDDGTESETPMFLTSKIYGSMYQSEINTISLIISNLIKPATRWHTSSIEYEAYSNARPMREYPAPVYFDYYATKLHYTSNDIDWDKLPMLKFKRVNCLECGTSTMYGMYGRCSDCAAKVYQCEICNQRFHQTKLHSGTRLCESCYDIHYCKCEVCSNDYPKSGMYIINGLHYCCNCVTKVYRKCTVCNEWKPLDSFRPVGDVEVCERCAPHVFQCTICKSVLPLGALKNKELIRCTGCNPGDIWYEYIYNQGKITAKINIDTGIIDAKYSVSPYRMNESIHININDFGIEVHEYPNLKRIVYEIIVNHITRNISPVIQENNNRWSNVLIGANEVDPFNGLRQMGELPTLPEVVTDDVEYGDAYNDISIDFNPNITYTELADYVTNRQRLTFDYDVAREFNEYLNPR